MKWRLGLNDNLSYIDSLTRSVDGDLNISIEYDSSDIARYELCSEHIDTLDKDEKTRAFFRAKSLLSYLRGAMFLIAFGFQDDYRAKFLPTKLYFGIDEFKSFEEISINDSDYEPSNIEIEEYYYPFDRNIKISSPYSKLGKIIELAKENKDVATILRLMGRGEIDVEDLYKIYELVLTVNHWDSDNNIISSNQKGKFRTTVNSPQYLRDDSRHTKFDRNKVIHESQTLNFLESVNLIRELSYTWIESLLENENIDFLEFKLFKKPDFGSVWWDNS
ncbi:MAG: hypothetical protein Q7U23_13795 [Methylococcales bacterium]|nr:hypothetical protein [Methylococcales bacterium]